MNEAFVQGFMYEVAPDILAVPFLSEGYCDFVLECCKQKDTWAPFKGDRHFSTYDIHLKNELPDLYEVLKDGLEEMILPRACKWWGIEPIEVSDLFALRYTMDTQTKLELHHDDSFVSASLKLNDDYEGSDLYFPRQKFGSKKVSVGTILIWPGQITHPHKATELVRGEKYSITVWTKQCTE